MVDVSAALSLALTIIGAFVFIVLKFFVAKVFKGWKGWIAKAIVAFVLAILAGITWNFCPAISVVLVLSILIISGLLGYGMILLAQQIPYVGTPVAYGLSVISGVIIVWIILMVIEFILNLALTITEIVLLFIPGVGWVVDIILLAVGILIPIIFPLIQIAISWGVFTSMFGATADCILSMGRTGAIPGTGGVHIGATK